MRCVKCNMELSEGSRFCEFCGAPQPAQVKTVPRAAHCVNCGKEIPFGSRFCPGCGAPQPGQAAGSVQPGQESGPPYKEAMRQSYGPMDAPKKGNGNKAVIIGCIAAAGVLFLLLAVSIVLFFVKRDRDGWGEPEKSGGGRTEQVREEEEELPEEEEPEEDSEPEEEQMPEEAAEPEEKAEEPESNPERTTDGPYAEIDFDDISYAPQSQPYDIVGEDELLAFNDRVGVLDIATEDFVEGTVHSVSGYRDLVTVVYYVPGTGQIRSIVTGEERMFGSQMARTTYLFENGELLAVKEEIFQQSSQPQYTDLYFFQEDCLIYKQFTASGVSNGLAYLRVDMESLDEHDQEDFMEDEAKYFNQGYKLYDAVSGW